MIEPFAIDLETGDVLTGDSDAQLALSMMVVAIQRELDRCLLGSVSDIEIFEVSQCIRVEIETPEGAKVQVQTDPITGWTSKGIAWMVMARLYQQRGGTVPARYVHMPHDCYAPDPLAGVAL